MEETNNSTETSNVPETKVSEENKLPEKKGNGLVFGVITVLAVVIIGTVVVMNNKNKTVIPMVGQTQGEQTQNNSGVIVNPNEETTEGTTGAASEGNANATVVNVEGGTFYFKPNEIKAKVGQPVKIVLTSVGGNHDFVIDELNVKSALVGNGKTTEVEFTPNKAGSFEFYCSVANHRAMGMKGTLIVE
jgi:plastocyanin